MNVKARLGIWMILLGLPGALLVTVIKMTVGFNRIAASAAEVDSQAVAALNRNALVIPGVGLAISLLGLLLLLVGTANSTVHRVNDLDLLVTDPSGQVYHGNYGLGGGYRCQGYSHLKVLPQTEIALTRFVFL